MIKMIDEVTTLRLMIVSSIPSDGIRIGVRYIGFWKCAEYFLLQLITSFLSLTVLCVMFDEKKS